MLFKGACGGRAVRLLHNVNCLSLRVKGADPASRSLVVASSRLDRPAQSLIASPYLGSSCTPLLPTRQLATRAVSRPKAHTGRSTSARKTGATKKSTARTKKAAKPKPKKRPKRVLTPEEKKKQEIRDLKKQIRKPPKQLPTTAWMVVFTEHAKSTTGRFNAADAVTKYRNLSPSEREHYNHIANENKAKNEAAYKRWIETMDPIDVRRANNARNRLLKLGARKHLPKLQDERAPKGPRSAYTLFAKDRWDSGDLAGVKVVDAGRIIGDEWKQLSAPQKQKYLDAAAKDKDRYYAESKRAYGS